MTPIRALKNSLPLQVAITIGGVWTMSLWLCLGIDLKTIHPLAAICLVGWQTWIYTGLFITAHDAMHGSIHPQPWLNRSIGQLCLWLYAGFDYARLSIDHHRHHQYPASDRDPDFHDGTATHFWGWYRHFVWRHISWRQALNLLAMLGIYMTICQWLLAQSVADSIVHPLLFWVIPSLLSSLQLFYFGTFLPHREPLGGYLNPHRAQTIARSRWWSLISCYHFGYHQEHHHSPQLPWWQLDSK